MPLHNGKPVCIICPQQVFHKAGFVRHFLLMGVFLDGKVTSNENVLLQDKFVSSESSMLLLSKVEA